MNKQIYISEIKTVAGKILKISKETHDAATKAAYKTWEAYQAAQEFYELAYTPIDIKEGITNE